MSETKRTSEREIKWHRGGLRDRESGKEIEIERKTERVQIKICILINMDYGVDD